MLQVSCWPVPMLHSCAQAFALPTYLPSCLPTHPPTRLPAQLPTAFQLLTNPPTHLPTHPHAYRVPTWLVSVASFLSLCASSQISRSQAPGTCSLAACRRNVSYDTISTCAAQAQQKGEGREAGMQKYRRKSAVYLHLAFVVRALRTSQSPRGPSDLGRPAVTLGWCLGARNVAMPDSTSSLDASHSATVDRRP